MCIVRPAVSVQHAISATRDRDFSRESRPAEVDLAPPPTPSAIAPALPPARQDEPLCPWAADFFPWEVSTEPATHLVRDEVSCGWRGVGPFCTRPPPDARRRVPFLG
jgi:hypothetical protein